MAVPESGRRLSLVVNPHAGRGRARRVLPKVVSELVQALPGTHVQVHQTESFDDARVRCHDIVEAARPGDSLVVMGGDGMAHLGVNACARTDVRLGVIPAGTGNDFCRGVGIPTSVADATRVIAADHVERIDLNLADGGHLYEGGHQRHVGCIVSTGYDARVNDRTNGIQIALGALAYGFVALAELATFTPLNYRIEVDGERRELPAMFIAVANSGYFGGGIQVAPQADPTDGMLDLTIVHPVSRMTLVRLLPTLYTRHTGAFLNHPAVELVRARRVTIDGDDMFAMADGERLGDVPLTVTVEPGALSIYR